MTDATPSNTPSTTEASSSRPDASTNGSNKNNAPKKRMSPRARFILRALGLLVLVIVAAWVLYYQFRGKYLESTNDAFVQADSVTVSSKVTANTLLRLPGVRQLRSFFVLNEVKNNPELVVE